MSATEKLRAMLDELGVKWYCPIELESSSFTRWLDRNGNRWTASDVCGVEKMGIGTTLTPEQAIAATLGSEHPCFAAESNYKRCKYSVNRGWCDDAPMLVWDDTGHLFVTLGGLKTWDVTDDAKEWFATLGSDKLTAEQVSKATYAHSIHADCADADFQAIAAELNAMLGKAVGA